LAASRPTRSPGTDRAVSNKKAPVMAGSNREDDFGVSFRL